LVHINTEVLQKEINKSLTDKEKEQLNMNGLKARLINFNPSPFFRKIIIDTGYSQCFFYNFALVLSKKKPGISFAEITQYITAKHNFNLPCNCESCKQKDKATHTIKKWSMEDYISALLLASWLFNELQQRSKLTAEEKKNVLDAAANNATVKEAEEYIKYMKSEKIKTSTKEDIEKRRKFMLEKFFTKERRKSYR